jgi:hypothetical protein
MHDTKLKSCSYLDIFSVLTIHMAVNTTKSKTDKIKKKPNIELKHETMSMIHYFLLLTTMRSFISCTQVPDFFFFKLVIEVVQAGKTGSC